MGNISDWTAGVNAINATNADFDASAADAKAIIAASLCLNDIASDCSEAEGYNTLILWEQATGKDNALIMKGRLEALIGD